MANQQVTQMMVLDPGKDEAGRPRATVASTASRTAQDAQDVQETQNVRDVQEATRSLDWEREKIKSMSLRRRLFTEEDHGLDKETKDEMDLYLAQTPDPEQARREVINNEWLSYRYSMPTGAFNGRRPHLMRELAAHDYGYEGQTIDDQQFFEVMGNGMRLDDHLAEAASTAGIKAHVPLHQSYAAWQQEAQKLPGWNAKRAATYWQKFQAMADAQDAELAPYRGLIAQSVTDLQILMGVKEGEPQGGWEVIASRLLSVPEKVRPLIFHALNVLGAAEEDVKGAWQKIGENLWRGTVSLATGLPNTSFRSKLMFMRQRLERGSISIREDAKDPVSAALNSAGEPVDNAMMGDGMQGAALGSAILSLMEKRRPLTEEETAAALAEIDRMEQVADLVRQIQDFAEGGYDPVSGKFHGIDPATSATLWKRGFYGAVRSAPQMGAAFVPGGIMFIGGQFAEDNYHQYRREHAEMPRETAHALALATAPYQAASSVVIDRLTLGRLPNFTRLVKAPMTTWKSVAGRMAVEFPAGTVAQGVDEVFQQLAPYAMQDLVAALEADVPGVPWSQVLASTRQSLPEIMATVPWLVLVGGGGANLADLHQTRKLAERPDLLEASGWSAEASAQIAQHALAGRWQEAQDLMREEWNEGRVQLDGTQLETQRERAGRALRGEAQAQQEAVAELEESGALPRVRGTENGTQVRFSDGTVLDFATREEAEAVRAMNLEEQQRVVHEEVRGALREVPVTQEGESDATARADTASDSEGAATVRTAPADQAGIRSHVEPHDANAAPTEATHVDASGSEAAPVVAPTAKATNPPKVEQENGNPAEAAPRVEHDADLDLDYRRASALATLTSPDAPTLAAVRAVLGNNASEFATRVREVAGTLNQRGKRTETKVREVMTAQAARMIAQGHRQVLIDGLRAVEREAEGAGGAWKVFRNLPDAELTDHEVLEAFADFVTAYVAGRKRGSDPSRRVREAVQRTKLGPVVDAFSQVFRAAASRIGVNGQWHAEGKLDPEPVKQTSYRDASFGSTPGSPSPSSERSQEERHAERARLHEGIPKGRDWISRMFKLNPKSALHEIARKAATLIDLVLDIDYSGPQFDNRNHFKELLFTDEPNPTQDNLYTNDYGRYEEPGKGPAQYHTSKDSPHPLMSSLHEIGHHLGKMLGAAAENEMANAHKGTRRQKTIVEDLSPKDAEYFNRGSEVFARAFAQLIATEMGKMKDANGLFLDPEVRDEFKRMLKDDKEVYKTWSHDDFAGVRDTLMKQLKNAGWKLRTTK